MSDKVHSDEMIKYQEEITSIGFDVLGFLGEGSYGKVLSVRRDNNIYAMKVMKYNFSKSIDNYAFCELYFTKYFNHPNIIKRSECGFTEHYCYFLMDRADYTFDEIILDPELSLDTIKDYVFKISDAIHHMHLHGYVHGDIKPVNILLKDDRLLICDLGYVKNIENAEGGELPVSECQTRCYRAPEQYHLNTIKINNYRKRFGKKSHISELASYSIEGEYWSLGILFLDIIYSVPFIMSEGNSVSEMFDHNRTNMLYHYFLEKASSRKSTVFDTIKWMFGEPRNDRIELLELVCKYLLRLDPRERSLASFVNALNHKLSMIIKPPYGLFDTIDIWTHQVAIDWMIEVGTELNIPLLVTMNTIDFYLTYVNLFVKKEYQLFIVVSVWLMSSIFVTTNQCPEINELIELTTNIYTVENFSDMVRRIMILTDGYPRFDSTYNKLTSLEMVKEAYHIMSDVEKYTEYQSRDCLVNELILKYSTQSGTKIKNILTYVPSSKTISSESGDDMSDLSE